jgi:predicted nucleotidyltransferase
MHYICIVMDQNEINISIVKYLRPYNPERIGIFGSFARREETSESDIDILVKFKKTISLLDLARIHRELKQILGRDIDLVTESSIKNERLKRLIFKDLKVIFE